MDIALAVIVDTDANAVIVSQRPAGKHLGGYWEFPGGKVEVGETVERAAIREALEETGLSVEIVERWGTIIWEYAERSVTLYPFLCHVTDTSSLNTNWSWISIHKLKDLQFPDANAEILSRLAERSDKI